MSPSASQHNVVHGRTSLAALILATSFACASSVPQISSQPIDWSSESKDWSVFIVTRDPDGDERVTRIWLAALDGEGVIRTGHSRWWQNLARDPHGALRIDGFDRPVSVHPITDSAERKRVDEAFLAKYGWQESLVQPSDRASTADNYMRLRSTLR